MTIEGLLAAIGVVALLGGCTLATIALYGLLLKPDLFDQLHVGGLLTGPAVILVLAAAVGTANADIITSAILVIGFVLITSSISTHAIAQAGARRYAPGVGPLDPSRENAPTEGPRPPEKGMRVVVAHDGSPAAHVASDLAAAIDWPAGTVVRLVGAADEEVQSMEAPARPGGDGPATGGESAIARDLDLAARTIRATGIQVETAILEGDPADVIVDETTALDADLLITGSRRRSFVQSLLGWSAAGEIVDRAPCPVLVARSSAIRVVMLATDGSPQSALAADLIARWPIFDLARIHVVSVSADDAASAPAGHQRIVDEAAARLMDAGREVLTDVLRGRPAERIVEAAQARSVDLIVIGSRGRTGLGRSLLGSVAGDVLAAARCSVMIVAPPPRRPPGGARPPRVDGPLEESD